MGFAIRFIPAAVFCFYSVCQAQGIYRSTDNQGKVTYSSKPSGAGSTPARLPKIAKVPMKLEQNAPSTCTLHGGINCAAGADADGSVICFDGHRDAVSRYNFSCRQARVEITEVKEKTPGAEYIVYVRNSTGIQADSPLLLYMLPRSERREIKGPGAIAPYGVEEFTVTRGPLDPAVNTTNLSATCNNCP